MAAGARKSASGLAKEFTFSKWRALRVLSISVFLALVAASPAAAQDVTAPDPGEFSARCLTCHAQEYLGSVASEEGDKSLYIDPTVYEESAHGILPCNSCHAGFTHDPHQMVTNAEFFAETAGEACKNCHDDQFEMYKQSYHGELSRDATADGVSAPLCVDCHGAHDIARVETLEYRQSIADLCGRCHGGRESTFLDTYHGKSLTLGREASATCVDCHGDHSILPVSNPVSKLSKANILPTCQECHPDATEGFTTFLVHIEPTSMKAPIVVFLVAMGYLALIVVVFAFGGIHSILYAYRGLKDGLYSRKGGH